MLDQARSLHQQGRLDEAASLYRKLLAQNPREAAALHLLGVIEVQRNNLVEGIALIERAIALEPDNAAFLCNRGIALQTLKRLDEALASFDRALAIDPGLVEAVFNRGNVLRDLNRQDEAIAAYDRALAIQPAYAAALNNRGLVLQELKRFDEALASFDRALAIKRDSAEVFNNRGYVLSGLKRFDEALESYDRALSIQPVYPEALNNRGNVLRDLRRYHDALASFDRALAIRPDYADALNGRGVALQHLKRFDEALAGFDRLLAVEPDHAQAIHNRGMVLLSLNRPEEALASYERALRVYPGYAEVLFSRGICKLTLGRMPDGWDDYENRWRTKNYPSVRRSNVARGWMGEDLRGRSILVCSEQGAGDIFQFCRYLPLLSRQGAEVTFLVPAGLRRILATLESPIRVSSAINADDPYDYQCALLSLPQRFRTNLSTIPSTTPYLRADPDLSASWSARIGSHGFKIGISWQGSAAFEGRSIPLSEFHALSEIPNVRLISLQKNYGLEQLANLPDGMKVETLGDAFDAGPDHFVDTAALMGSLDLIVSCDTSIAHLAGALARPTWVALKQIPDCRWMLNRNDSPWYPSMRLFRQKIADDWSTVFREMADALEKLLAAVGKHRS